MKVLRRSLIIYNEILFIIMSLYFMHLVYSLDVEASALDFEQLIILLKMNPILVGIGVATIVSLFFVKKISKYLLAIFALFVFYKTFSVFLIKYEKIQLVLNVIYIVIAYNMILLLDEELERSIYRPNYFASSLDVEDYKTVKVEFYDGNKSVEGFITSYDDEGFVVKLTRENKLSGKVHFKIVFENHDFEDFGVVSVKYKGGYGIKVSARKKSQDDNGWSVIYDILSKRGYV
jgi:hypothetical protein